MFCGGGSAGHVMPNIAIYEIIKDKYRVAYMGTDAIEKTICKNYGIPFYEFDGVKLVRGKIMCNLAIPYKLIKSVAQCRTLLENAAPDLLFCKGGYASLPPALAARKTSIPVITHESDLTAGLANKIIARKSAAVLTSFATTADGRKNWIYTGSPMRESLFGRNREESKRKYGLDGRKTVLVFGGGSGSRIINDNLRRALGELCKDFNVLHVCGKGNAVDAHIYGYKQIEFCDDMGAAYACCDLAIARCGSNSAHELIALKIPTLFIPLENGASRGDQVKNAEYFNKHGLCRVLREDKLTPQTLTAEIKALASDEKIKKSLANSSIECGNDNIIKEIERLIK